MIIESKEKKNILYVKLDGKIDMETAPELDAFLKEHLDGIDSFEFDFKKVDYISSAGLRIFMWLNRQGADKTDYITIKNMNDTVKTVFDLTGFTDLFEIK